MKTEEHIEAIARAAKDYADWRETFGEEKAWAQLKAAIRAAQPAGAQQPGAAYAEMPTHSHAGRVYEEGFLIGTCPLYTADKMRAFADATCAMRATPAQFARGFEAAKAQFASHGQAPAQAAAPAQAGEYPALVCDYCGALTPDPWHSSGMLHGKMSKHIHSCDACCRGAAQPSPPQEAQADSVLKDADTGRLDWLERHSDGFYNLDRISSVVGKGFLTGPLAPGLQTNHATLREAIDSARKQGGAA